MSFDLEKFFKDIFAPQENEVVTLLCDLPHNNISDTKDWKELREMVDEWQKKLFSASEGWGIKVNPVVTYNATGTHNAPLPAAADMGGKEIELESVINASNIVLIMSKFSATATLKTIAKNSGRLRGASMPGVAKFMEQTSLSADYSVIQERCRKLAPEFQKAIGVHVTFSTGHTCYFDISTDNPVHRSDGYLHPEVAGTIAAVCNLPTGEVYVVPNETAQSKTAGELPEKIGDEIVVYVVKNNRIIDVKGDTPKAKELKQSFQNDKARCNIAEVAIGCNDKARVCGNILEDEKAGFHWAYGRSDHFGGLVGIKDFLSPQNVIHQDIVYAKDCPIICSNLAMIFPEGDQKTLIVDGELKI
ncbi:MAG: hypothetical protein COS89_02595 [Deltaproteobacteria bacterium CG07_land_8_20_14_0_80_38_7]|nr:MAG: hypothetical protein COS89_02595 [Deltaproteobacteria bacterium CG07_land_8_20_14_0_80_38_7]